MKVYVVTSGVYDSYTIEAVFTNEDVADAYADRQNRASSIGDYRVEPWDSDIALVRPDFPIAFRVSYSEGDWFSGGWGVSGDPDRDTLPFEDVRHEQTFDPFTPSDPIRSRQWWETWVWAHDIGEARTIGQERITPALTEAGITPKDSPLGRADTPFLNFLKVPEPNRRISFTWGFGEAAASVRLDGDTQPVPDDDGSHTPSD